MSRFMKELRVIPKAAWIFSLFAYLCFTVSLFFFVVPTDPEIGKWPRWGQALFVHGMFVFVLAWVALNGYIYGDAKRRQMRYVLWTLLAIFTPSGVGMILYFILRDPLPKPCPGCGHVEKTAFPFCPKCGTLLRPSCPKCGESVDPTWANCAHCGQRLPEPTPRATQDRALAT
ncbi:MAG TPA: zinc ribbon domain-containing protein [Candidatus Sulfotelmatobacter sp.]|nr:zinc ribbon domain-containing protein [Candidatus Sulfotelmatobacter sp.]